jgi:hypothetical protein
MSFKISYPQGRWMDVTTDIGMAIDYFMDFDGMAHTLFNRGKPNDKVMINQTGRGTCGA